MSTIIEPGKRGVLAGLFANHRRMRILIDSALEGRFGIAIADSEHDPRVARLTVSVFTFLGGDPEHPEARELIKELPGTWVVPESEAWRDLMIRVHGERLNKHQRIDFNSDRFNVDHLRELQKHVPESFQVKRIDMESVCRLGYDGDKDYLGPMLLKDFVKHGIGFWAIAENRWVSTAYSAVTCKAGIEIQINTKPDFQRKGLATCVGAALIVHCLERGIEPHWSAANSISTNLAEKLGYVQCDSYECLCPELRPFPSLREVGYLQWDSALTP